MADVGGSRLGWMQAPERMRGEIPALRAFAAEIRGEGVRDVLLVGMGGSSLFPEVLAASFPRGLGFPSLRILDTTCPSEILECAKTLDPGRTLVLAASKSGTTVEVDALLRFLRGRFPDPRRFAAITDPGSPLEAEARRAGFRKVFLNPADVGGRFSALTLFGLLPAALLGLDPAALLAGAAREAAAPGGANALAEVLVKRKTLELPGEPFSAWIEQLVAESLGKDGKGILPVVARPAAAPERSLEALGAECYRWELAVARAGSLLGVNPFDEPEVALSKQATRRLLASGSLPDPGKPAEELKAWLKRGRPGDYLALLAWMPRSPGTLKALEDLRAGLSRAAGLPATLGFGPRYLHSTGQFHKGGPDRGLFLLLIAEEAEDAAIPGSSFGFRFLHQAQALGDLEALRGRGRRVLACRLEGDPAAACGIMGGCVRSS